MIYQASIVGLARTLLIIIAIYWGFRLFTRYVLPWVLKLIVTYLGKKAQENMNSRGFQSNGFQNAREETVNGNEKVTIKKTTKKSSSKKPIDDMGEYVDFEEIK